MKKTTAASWDETLRTAGIQKGDTVMLHSHLPALGFLEGGAEMLIETLLASVGQEGTVVMPTFTLSFGRTRAFNREESPSEMGVLTEIFRKRPDVLRSSHPFHSVATWGRRAQEIASSRCLSSFGQDSPFEKIHQWNAWLLCAGVGAERLTFVHYVEEREGVLYRIEKEYPGQVRVRGDIDPTTYKMYSRDPRFKMNLGGWTELLARADLDKTHTLPYGTLHVYRAKAVYRTVAALLKKDPGILLTQESPFQELLEGRIQCTS